MGVVARVRVILRNTDADCSPPSNSRTPRRGMLEDSRPVATLQVGSSRRSSRNALVIVMLAACAAVLASRVTATAGPDTWYSLLAGRLIWHDGLPHHDTLTALTLGRTWVDQEWLGHLGIYGLFATGGWALALLVGVAGFIAAFAVSAAGARARGASERSAALVALAAFIAGAPNTELRAQTFAYVLFALTLALLLGDDRSPSRRVFLDAAAARRLGERARVGPARRRPRRALRGDLDSPIGAQRKRRREVAAAGGRIGTRALVVRPRLAVRVRASRLLQARHRQFPPARCLE